MSARDAIAFARSADAEPPDSPGTDAGDPEDCPGDSTVAGTAPAPATIMARTAVATGARTAALARTATTVMATRRASRYCLR